MRSLLLLLSILLATLLQTRAQFDCGKNSKNTVILRITGGQASDPKHWPWMAALMKGKQTLPFCGGSLLSARHVLTAAHCVRFMKSSDVRVRLGEYDFDTPDENKPTDFNVQEIYRHERYNQDNFENDIAILLLERSATFGEYISPVCLPPPSNSFQDQLGYVTGWGAKKFGGSGNPVLHEVLIKVWKMESCASAYPGSFLADSMMCCGWMTGEGDSCQGDSGGPFMIQIPPGNRWHVTGIVSWGIQCADPKHPGVYTRVNHYLEWIDAKIKLSTPTVVPQKQELVDVELIPEQATNRPFDCSEVCSSKDEFCGSGIYQIYPNGPQPVDVFCDMTTTVGGWTVLLTKLKTTPASYFHKSFQEYKKGFGKADAEHWIGNENLHQMTKRKDYTLRIDSKPINKPNAFVEFKKIKLRPENTNYKLILDMLVVGNVVIVGDKKEEGLSLHDGPSMFSNGDGIVNVAGGNQSPVYAEYLQMKIRPNS